MEINNTSPRIKDWEDFKIEIKDRVSAETINAIEAQLPSITIDVGAKEFDALMEGLRSKSIPANKIILYLVSTSGLKTDELNRRIKKLVDTLEAALNITEMSLQLPERRNILPGFEDPYVPFFKYFSSPKCRIEDLKITLAYSKSSRELLQLGFKDNTSLKKLWIECTSEAWTFLDAIKSPLTSLRIHSTNMRSSQDKKGTKALISLLKNCRTTLTTFGIRCNMDDTKDILSILSDVNTLIRFEWTNHGKFSGDVIAPVLENNPKLEELSLGSGCYVENKIKALLKPLTALCQNQLRILKLNLSSASCLIPALENNNKITKLLLSEHELSYQKAVATIATMKKLKNLTLAQHISKKDYLYTPISSVPVGNAIDWPGVDTEMDLKADLTTLISANSPIRHLKISNYLFVPTDEFFAVLQTTTSLSTLEFKFENQHRANEFLTAQRMNPFLTIIWPIKQPTVRSNMTLFKQKNAELLKSVQNCLTVLQTIFLAKDRGLFAGVPNEVLFTIFRHYTDQQLNAAQLTFIFDAASKHEWIFENLDTRSKIRALWQSVMSAKLAIIKRQSSLTLNVQPDPKA